MAIINQKTGYYGFTTDGLGGPPIDKNGNVERVIFSIVYPNRVNDIDFTISNGADDWAAMMGDGSIIPIRNPVVLFQNRDNTIVQFSLDKSYPSNSPCILVYRSDTAWFNVKEISGSRPWKENTVSGHFGFTVEGDGGTAQGNGCVNRLECSIPYPVQMADVEFTISEDPSHWGAMMGDGSIINLRDPVVMFSNRDSAVVQFTMDTAYPSNSPCVIVYRSPDAWFRVKVITEEPKFVPVSNIRNVPSTITAGVGVDLSPAVVEPPAASRQGIIWDVVSGPATVNGDSLLATAQGNIVLKATIELGVSDTEDYTQNFNITAAKNKITIVAQPDKLYNATVGEVDHVITINAKSDSGVISYRWYRNTSPTYNGGTALSGASTSSYRIPTTLAKGDYYFYCEVKSPGAATVNSEICHVHVAVKLTGIEILPRTSSLGLRQERQLTVAMIPNEADVMGVTWASSDPHIIQVDSDGKIMAIASGDAVITATTVDGKHKNTLSINVPVFKPVTNITGIMTTADTGKSYTLSGTVVPADATNKLIEWSLLDAGTTGATVVNGIFLAKKEGAATVRAKVKNGFTLTSDYNKDTVIDVNRAFVPVTDVTLLDVPTDIHADEFLELKCAILPELSTSRSAEFSIVTPGATGAKLEGNKLTFTGAGEVTIRVTVTNGVSPTTDFKKDFNITILPAWIPVTLVTISPETYDPSSLNGQPVTLVTTVTPDNATRKDVNLRMVDRSEALATFDAGTNKLQIDPKNMTHEMSTGVVMEVKIVDGVGRGIDYVANISIPIVPLPPPEVYVPVTDVQLKLPNPMRAWYPVLLNRAEVFPWNSNVKNLMWSKRRYQEYMGADSYLYTPDPEDPFIHLGMNPFFDWDVDEPILFPYDPGKAGVTLLMEKGLGPNPGEDYTQEYVLEFLPPFIPVKGVTNIPLRIPCKTNITLSGELETYGGTGYHNPTWDEDIPSKTGIYWRFPDSVQYPNRAGATIEGNVIYAARPGTFSIQAHVSDAVQEGVEWYGKRQKQISYNEVFTITAVDEELPYDSPIVTLKLKNGSSVKIYKLFDLFNCCTDAPASATITIGKTTFKKSDVVEAKFWDQVPLYGDDPTISVENIQIPQTKVDVNPKVPEETLEDFSTVVLDNEPDGCVQDVEEGSIFKGMWKLPANTFIKPDGTIVKCYIDPNKLYTVQINDEYAADGNGAGEYKAGETVTISCGTPPEGEDSTFFEWQVLSGDVTLEDPKSPTTTFVMPAGNVIIRCSWNYAVEVPPEEFVPQTFNLRATADFEETVLNSGADAHVDAPFKVDPNKLQYRKSLGLVKYNNGYVGIPEGWYLDTFGALIKSGSRGNDIIIFANGLIQNNDTDNPIIRIDIPIGSTLINGLIKLPDGTVFDGKDFHNGESGLPQGVLIPTGSITQSDGSIDIPNAGSFEIANIAIDGTGDQSYTILTSDSGEFTLSSNGVMFNDAGKIWDADGNEIVNYINVSADTVTITPKTSTTFNKISWSLEHKTQEPGNDDISKLIEVPTKGLLLVPGSAWEGAVLTATVTNGIGWQGQDYVKKFSIDIGDASVIAGKTITAINTNYETKLVFARRRYQFINLTASMVGLGVSYSDAEQLQWSFSGNKSRYTAFSSSYFGGSDTAKGNAVSLRVGYTETSGTDIKVKVKAGSVEEIITIKLVSEFEEQPAVTSLRNFGRNFTSLTKIDRIPDVITGDDCLRNFLMGCTSFNQPIEIPEGVTGTRCLKHFLRDCTSFNSLVTIPSTVTGEACLYGFLYGCTSFNTAIEIPEGVTGKSCLERFLIYCENFNQPLEIPDGVSGEACLRNFLTEAHHFNRPLTLPASLDGVNNIDMMLRDCNAMVSPITVSVEVAEKADGNGQTFSSVYTQSDMISHGLPIVGPGADILKAKLPNYPAPPNRNLI